MLSLEPSKESHLLLNESVRTEVWDLVLRILFKDGVEMEQTVDLIDLSKWCKNCLVAAGLDR